MGFFETWLGMSPDGGDGSLEAVWIAAIVVAVVAVVFRRRIADWLSSRLPDRD